MPGIELTVLSSEALPLFSAPHPSRREDSSPDDALPEATDDATSSPTAWDDEVESRASASLTPAQMGRIKRIVVEHHSFVWRSLVRLGVPRADAEDAVQQVFMVTTRRIDDITAGSERSFLYGVAIRVASRSRRTRARRREVLGDAGPERVDTAARPDDLIDRAEARRLLDEILESMPIELRVVFTLFELEQMTMVDIAALIEVPQGTVASRLRRAREHFAEQRKRMEARIKGQLARPASPRAADAGNPPALRRGPLAARGEEG